MRRFKSGCFETRAQDLPANLRLLVERQEQPTAAIYNCRTLQFDGRERGVCTGYDGAKKRKGSKVHVAVDTLDHLLPLKVRPANEQDSAQVAATSEAKQEATGESVQMAFVDQGNTAQTPAQDAAVHGVRLEVIKLSEAKRGVVLLPTRRLSPVFIG